jgi:hypothetical protein
VRTTRVSRPPTWRATLAANPADSLFNPIDADDPLAAVPTYEHLKKGLVRVRITLAANMDLIDGFGNVTTPPDRTIDVWRAVPTDSKTAPSRRPTSTTAARGRWQQQAQGAVTAHSQGGTVPARGSGCDRGVPARSVFLEPRQEGGERSSPTACRSTRSRAPSCRWTSSPRSQQRGLAFTTRLARSATAGRRRSHRRSRRARLRDPELKPDGSGNVLFDSSVTPPVPVRANQPNNEFLNIGIANLSAFGQFGFPAQLFNASVPLPQYRYRFYTDATRTVPTADLPPVPVFDPVTFLPLTDENGAPIVGPNFLPQFFSTDPGRSAITGDPHDFEAFDVPRCGASPTRRLLPRQRVRDARGRGQHL